MNVPVYDMRLKRLFCKRSVNIEYDDFSADVVRSQIIVAYKVYMYKIFLIMYICTAHFQITHKDGAKKNLFPSHLSWQFGTYVEFIYVL